MARARWVSVVLVCVVVEGLAGCTPFGSDVVARSDASTDGAATTAEDGGGGATCACAAGSTGSTCEKTLVPSFLWLDASDSTTVVFKNGLEVAEWRDKSGLGRHATVPSGSMAPVWVDNSINTRPAIRFDGSTVRLRTAPIATSAEMTVFVVFNMVAPAPWGSLINQELDAYYFTIRKWDSNPALLFQIDENFKTPLQPLLEGTWKVLTAVRDGTTSTMYYAPDAATAHTGDALKGGVSVAVTIGNALTLAESMGGFVAEIRAFNTALNAGARASVEAELKTKYAIP